MPLSVNIKEIERRGNRVTYIRIGKAEYEAPGRLSELRQWVRSQVEAITPLQLAALRLAAHLKTDPDLLDVTPMIGKTSILTIDGKDVT